MNTGDVALRYLFLLLILAGCATHPAVPYGKDTFIITSDDSSGMFGRGRTQARALQAANEHCTKMGKKMQVKESTASGNVWTGTGAQVIFSCVDQ